MQEPLFTIIMDAYYKPHFLRQAVEAILCQTYTKLEVILINNGATSGTLKYLYEVEAQDRRVTLVHFEENQFSYEDPLKMIDVCYNKALGIATGEYVFYQSYDDLMANNYVEKMVELFQENQNCITAAGIVITMDSEGNLLGDKETRSSNYRPKYMPGHLLALDDLRGHSTMFGYPGTIFTIKRKTLIEAGGYHRSLELSQLYGIVPFGVTGFDETAVFYWRRHEAQLNKLLMNGGYQTLNTLSLLKDWDIQTRWENAFNQDIAKKVIKGLKNHELQSATTWFIINLFQHRIPSSFRIAKKVWKYSEFWKNLIYVSWQRKNMIGGPFRPYIKKAFKKLFSNFPALTSFPFFLKLHKRVNRFS